MDLAKRYEVDAEKAKDGVRVPIGDAIFILAYYNSAQAQIAFHSNIERLKAVLEADEAAIEAMHQTLIQKVVLGWENLKEDGVELIYSKEELKRILVQYVGLDIELMDQANYLENFKRIKKEAIEKK